MRGLGQQLPRLCKARQHITITGIIACATQNKDRFCVGIMRQQYIKHSLPCPAHQGITGNAAIIDRDLIKKRY